MLIFDMARREVEDGSELGWMSGADYRIDDLECKAHYNT